MARTNIELDDELVAEVMRRFGARTKREAVDLALRRLVGPPLTVDLLNSVTGIGWDGDLDEMRSHGVGSRGMILVDSSVWIDRLRGTRSRAFDALDTLVAERPTEVAITEQIQMELCAGAAPADVASVEALTASLVLLGVDPSTDYHAAAVMFRATRANGRVARKLADCLIASVALRHDAEVWHRDADFEAIAAVTALRTVDLR